MGAGAWEAGGAHPGSGARCDAARRAPAPLVPGPPERPAEAAAAVRAVRLLPAEPARGRQPAGRGGGQGVIRVVGAEATGRWRLWGGTKTHTYTPGTHMHIRTRTRPAVRRRHGGAPRGSGHLCDGRHGLCLRRHYPRGRRGRAARGRVRVGCVCACVARMRVCVCGYDTRACVAGQGVGRGRVVWALPAAPLPAAGVQHSSTRSLPATLTPALAAAVSWSLTVRCLALQAWSTRQGRAARGWARRTVPCRPRGRWTTASRKSAGHPRGDSRSRWVSGEAQAESRKLKAESRKRSRWVSGEARPQRATEQWAGGWAPRATGITAPPARGGRPAAGCQAAAWCFQAAGFRRGSWDCACSCAQG